MGHRTSLCLVTSSAFIGTVKDLYIDSWMTQHDTATSRTFLKVTLQAHRLWGYYLKEQPHRLHKMAVKNGRYFTRKKCTWYSIFWIFNNMFVKYRYFPFTVQSLMLGIALLPFENVRSVCDLSEQNNAKCVNKQQANSIILSC